MPFPEKFRALIEIAEDQIPIPEIVYLAYSVCAVEPESCGWNGWTIESAKRTVVSIICEVDADADQICPHCGRPLFRIFTKQFQLNAGWEPIIDYDAVPIEFE